MIKVLASGLLSTIQDLGRFGYRRLGVPLSGAMDQYAADLANELIGNDKEAAVMEITMTGPVLEFTEPTIIAITGAGFTPTINNSEVPLNTRLHVHRNDILKFGLAAYGWRGYLAVMGGFLTETVLGSRSQYFGLTPATALQKGALLLIPKVKDFSKLTTTSVKERLQHFTEDTIHVFKGPDFGLLSAALQKKIERLNFTVSSKSNRMSYLLDSDTKTTAPEIITAPVQPGTVQLTPSGQCIVLMRDAQTTGGYARILQLTDAAINELAQKKAGDSIHFRIVDLPS